MSNNTVIEKNKQNGGSFLDLGNYEPAIHKLIAETIAEYNEYNKAMIKVMNIFEKIYLSKSCTDVDLAELINTNYYYHTDIIYHEGQASINSDISNNIRKTTMSESYEKSFIFFDSQNVNEWERKLNEYRNVFLQIDSGKWVALVGYVNKLHEHLLVLHKDFNLCTPNFQYVFNIKKVISRISSLSFIEQREIVLRQIVEAKEFCLINEITNSNDEEQFVAKCNKLLEIIELKAQNDSSRESNSSDQNENTTSLNEKDIFLNRQFMAIYYLLDAVDKEVFSRNKAEVARFIQLLTSKSYNNIYKLAQNPIKDPAERVSKKHEADIQFVKDAFMKLGLNKIAKQIENDNLFS